MSWSLQLRNGDLVSDGAQLAQVTNQNKLIQDLRCAILERRGTDDMHPRFGSLIDGGYDDQGNWVSSLIGEDEINFVVTQVESDLRKIALEHQSRQAARAQDDRLVYGASTLNNPELLMEVRNVRFIQSQDKLMVTVSIRTGGNQDLDIDVPISTRGIL